MTALSLALVSPATQSNIELRGTLLHFFSEYLSLVPRTDSILALVSSTWLSRSFSEFGSQGIRPSPQSGGQGRSLHLG
jgi:hypothetical protein